MTPVEEQIADLKRECPGTTARKLSSGAHLIEVAGVTLPSGWSANKVKVIFLAPVGYPGAQPDCFWVEPSVRANQQQPQSSNDNTAIPESDIRGTWFSWHVQGWDPNHDTLIVFFNVIMRRLVPAR